MIDLSTEKTLSLTQAAHEPIFPPGRKGARPTLSCVLRWVLKGLKGPHGRLIRLEAVRLGGRWITSREAIQRFADALTPRLDGEPAPVPRTPCQRRKAAERAERELDEARIK